MRPQPRIVILGVTGMLGHKMFQSLCAKFPDVYGVSRDLLTSSRFCRVALLQNSRILQGIDAQDWNSLAPLLRRLAPDYIVNCIGIVKQRSAALDPIPSLLINSLLPHRLSTLAAEWGGRLIHFSTDCVFSGRKGNYCEEDPSDAEDLYGRTKFLGEVAERNALTLRTSIIGRELAEYQGLLEWFLAQRGRTVRGYTKAIYSGVTTNYVARLTAELIDSQTQLHGVFQLAATPISKYELLCLIRQLLQLEIEVEAVDGEICDRSMCADRFLAATGRRCPSWPELIHEIQVDTTPYEAWRTCNDATFQAF